MRARRFLAVLTVAAVAGPLATAAVAGTPGPSAAAAGHGPKPGSPAYLARDQRNIEDAYGRQTAPDGQLSPTYIKAVIGQQGVLWADQFFGMSANPTRPALDPGQLVPGWNAGSPTARPGPATAG
jgi:hypothetical protein